MEKGLELLYKDTIDTFRLRLHNPKTVLQELVFNCMASKEGFLTNNQYAHSSGLEVKRFLQSSDHEMSFKSINREYYLEVIQTIKKENYNRIIQASNLLLRNNRDYGKNLAESIFQSFQEFDPANPPNHEYLKNFIQKIHYWIVDLVYKGYTKQYLYQFFRSIFVFVGNSTMSFENRYTIWRGLEERPNEKFQVIFHINGESFQYKDLKRVNPNYVRVNNKFRSTLPAHISSRVKGFLEEKKKENLIAIEIESNDYFKAVEITRSKLATDLDIYHLGYNNKFFIIEDKGVVIGSKDPSKASILPMNYQIDGYVRSSREVFEKLLEKVNKLKGNEVSLESIDKILSAIRYLRTGSESLELETKLLNYWIGLEYIFTLFNGPEKTIDVIRKYFPVCHAVIYVKRNLFDFHKALERLDVASQIPDYNIDLKYLAEYSTYETINQNTDSELLKFRSQFYQKWTSDPSNIKKSLFKHQENLDWNITRLYKIRNEIVHNAVILDNIYANVSHIKYYLTFILNSLIDFMSDIPVDVNSDGKITIEDYFITQDIILGSLKGKTVSEYIKVDNPLELVS